MSTVTRVSTPVLVEGDHIDQPEFHRRYEAMPPGIKAELIDGVVYLPSPVGLDHGDSHASTAIWLGFYAIDTQGLEAVRKYLDQVWDDALTRFKTFAESEEAPRGKRKGKGK